MRFEPVYSEDKFSIMNAKHFSWKYFLDLAFKEENWKNLILTIYANAQLNLKVEEPIDDYIKNNIDLISYSIYRHKTTPYYMHAIELQWIAEKFEKLKQNFVQRCSTIEGSFGINLYDTCKDADYFYEPYTDLQTIIDIICRSNKNDMFNVYIDSDKEGALYITISTKVYEIYLLNDKGIELYKNNPAKIIEVDNIDNYVKHIQIEKYSI